MAIKIPARLKVNQLLITMLGLVILSASVLIYLLIIQNVYGKYELSEILPTKANLSQLAASQGRVAILYSKYTENMLPAGSTWLNDNINTWKRFISANNYSCDIISDQTIELGQHNKYQLLILPGSRSLSDKEISQIKRFIEKGGSVFATSGTASFSDDGKWRGWDFFSEVFGLNFTRELKPEESTKIHTLRGNLPITAGIPTGYTLKIATWDIPMACEVLEPRTTQASFWYNFRSDSGLVHEELGKSAGIAYGKYGAGKFVWFGFELNSIIGSQEDYINFDKLFRNSMHWLTNTPIAYISDWPNNYSAAAMIIPTISYEPQNIRNILGYIRNDKIPVTFFLDPNYQTPEYINMLSNFGEIGSVVDIGYLASMTDTVNKLQDYRTQLSSFRTSKHRLKALPRQTDMGVIPLYGLYDQTSVHALIDADYQYIITDSLTDRAVPQTLIKGDKSIIAFTKTARDDYEIVRNYGLKDKAFQIYTYQEDIDRLIFQGGLYILKLHTDYQLRPEYASVLKDLVHYMRKNKIWLASSSEIVNWWKTKNSLIINTYYRSKRRVAIEISNPSSLEINNVIVQIDLNKMVTYPKVTSDIFGTHIPKYSYNKGDQTMKIYIKKLQGNGTLSYNIDYDEIKVN